MQTPRWSGPDHVGGSSGNADRYLYAISLEVFRLDCGTHEGFNRIRLGSRTLRFRGLFGCRGKHSRKLREEDRSVLYVFSVCTVAKHKVDGSLVAREIDLFGILRIDQNSDHRRSSGLPVWIRLGLLADSEHLRVLQHGGV